MGDLDFFLPIYRWGDVMPSSPSTHVRIDYNYQFYKMVPTSVLKMSGTSGTEALLVAGDIEGAIASFKAAAGELAKLGANAIVLAGVPVAAQIGRPRTLELLRETREKYGVPAASPFEAFLSGMKHLGLKSVAIGTRWDDVLIRQVRDYCQDGGIEVAAVSTHYGKVPGPLEMSLEQALETSLAVGREAVLAARQADAIFVPGGALAGHVIPVLEREFGKPVFTNTNSEVWELLVHPGIIPPVQGWGRLLATP